MLQPCCRYDPKSSRRPTSPSVSTSMLSTSSRKGQLRLEAPQSLKQIEKPRHDDTIWNLTISQWFDQTKTPNRSTAPGSSLNQQGSLRWGRPRHAYSVKGKYCDFDEVFPQKMGKLTNMMTKPHLHMANFTHLHMQTPLELWGGTGDMGVGFRVRTWTTTLPSLTTHRHATCTSTKCHVQVEISCKPVP